MFLKNQTKAKHLLIDKIRTLDVAESHIPCGFRVAIQLKQITP
jgi:hypothetical protein